MALRMDVELDSGMLVHDAYVKVDAVMGSRKGMEFTLNYYVDRDASNTRPFFLQERYNVAPRLGGGAQDIFRQCYVYLRRNYNKFENAVDIIEKWEEGKTPLTASEIEELNAE
ncbi:hypothetical protein MM326_13565 [Alkalihalobacillus sp. LMS6]|uniref:hypothetical protein n=1 Tax=Alkalihalobacillus sp. LMS6 TaxID=2924034 RepID=UPI0020D1A8C9|nr:hypothetical protein [Alkalihalobacillus sp. LMS6]UTR05136.1 hypothetical protein MM326_13565 [Alkalihalobacillus sp. LMS6]